MKLELFPIRNDEDHERAVRLIAKYWEAKEGTPEEAYMDALATLVDRYERQYYPLPKSTPLEVLKFMMEQNDRTQTDLARLLGSRSRASEILNGKRELTLDNIKLLVREWHIPPGALLGDLASA